MIRQQILKASLSLITAFTPVISIAAGGDTPDETPWTPEKIRQVYGIDKIRQQGLQGEGQFIAVGALGTPDLSKVRDYAQKYGLPQPQIEIRRVNPGAPKSDPNFSSECEIDIEMILAVAPLAHILVFVWDGDAFSGPFSIAQAITADGRAKVASYSYNYCESDDWNEDIRSNEITLEKAQQNGLNFFVAAGDSFHPCPEKYMPYPATSPNVIAVGATTMQSSQQYAWSFTVGGPSTNAIEPDFQHGIEPITHSGHRVIPDLSFGGGNWVFANAEVNGWQKATGTSLSTPLLAALMVLVNEARQTKHRPTLGYLNPILYAMSANDHNAIFFPTLGGSNGRYSVPPNQTAADWNFLTGWGAPHADALLEYLVKQ